MTFSLFQSGASLDDDAIPIDPLQDGATAGGGALNGQPVAQGGVEAAAAAAASAEAQEEQGMQRKREEREAVRQLMTLSLRQLSTRTLAPYCASLHLAAQRAGLAALQEVILAYADYMLTGKGAQPKYCSVSDFDNALMMSKVTDEKSMNSLKHKLLIYQRQKRIDDLLAEQQQKAPPQQQQESVPDGAHEPVAGAVVETAPDVVVAATVNDADATLRADINASSQNGVDQSVAVGTRGNRSPTETQREVDDVADEEMPDMSTVPPPPVTAETAPERNATPMDDLNDVHPPGDLPIADDPASVAAAVTAAPRAVDRSLTGHQRAELADDVQHSRGSLVVTRADTETNGVVAAASTAESGEHMQPSDGAVDVERVTVEPDDDDAEPTILEPEMPNDDGGACMDVDMPGAADDRYEIVSKEPAFIEDANMETAPGDNASNEASPGGGLDIGPDDDEAEATIIEPDEHGNNASAAAVDAPTLVQENDAHSRTSDGTDDVERAGPEDDEAEATISEPEMPDDNASVGAIEDVDMPEAADNRAETDTNEPPVVEDADMVAAVGDTATDDASSSTLAARAASTPTRGGRGNRHGRAGRGEITFNAELSDIRPPRRHLRRES